MVDVRLFGEITISRDGTDLPAPPAKALELLCYLLVHRERTHTREHLAELLWPEGDPDASRRYLRQSLWRLNTTLGHGLTALPDPILVADQDRVRINHDAIHLDVGVFEQVHAATRGTPGQHLTLSQVDILCAAVGLYRGDLLATSGYDWAGGERDRVRLSYLAMLEQLMDHCEAHRLFARGQEFGQIVVRLDPARESAHRRLMRLSRGAGDRVSALRQFEQCARILAAEFGIKPSAETVALYRRIRADDPDLSTVDNSGPPRSAPVGPAELADLHSRLDQIQHLLTTLQETIARRRPPDTSPDLITRNGSPTSD